MSDNNKKTFADLFSETGKEVQNSEKNELTFDKLFDNFSESNENNIEEVSNEKNDVNFSDILSGTITYSDEESHDYSNIGDSALDNDFSFGGSVVEENKSLNDILDNDVLFDEKKEDNKDSFLFNADSVLVDDKENFLEDAVDEESKVVENLESNLVIDNEKVVLDENKSQDYIEKSDDAIDEQVFVNDSDKLGNSLFFGEETEEKKVDENLFFNDKEENIKEDENVELDSNLFFNDKDKVENNSNLFFDNGEKVVEEDKNVDISEEKTVSTSPFFASDVMEEKVDSLLPDAILLEQNSNINTNNSKIELNGVQHYNVKVVKKKPSLFKFLVGVVSYAIFIFLMLVGVALLVYVLDIKIRASKGDYSTPTFNAYVVLTGSMLPDIQVKDVVVTKKVDVQLLNEGDIITFASADSRFLGTVITHRIIKKNISKDGVVTFQTKGDNNNVADNALVPAGNIYGKVILKIPKLGYLQDFLATQGGWIVVILIPCLAVISYDIVKLSKGLKKKKVRNVKVKK